MPACGKARVCRQRALQGVALRTSVKVAMLASTRENSTHAIELAMMLRP